MDGAVQALLLPTHLSNGSRFNWRVCFHLCRNCAIAPLKSMADQGGHGRHLKQHGSLLFKHVLQTALVSYKYNIQILYGKTVDPCVRL